MIEFPEGREPVADLGAAAWVSEAIGDHPRLPLKVGDLVAPVFDAYARILHAELRPEEELVLGVLDRRRTEKEARRYLEGLPPQMRIFGAAVPSDRGHGERRSPVHVRRLVPATDALVAGRPGLAVHTEIDAMSTFVGGSRGLVDELVG